MKTTKKNEKSEKIVEKPIKKHNLFKKIRINIHGKKNDFVKYKNRLFSSSDFYALKQLIFETLAYGIPIGSIVSFFLSSNILLTILVTGLFMVLLDKKLLYIICQILSSINLVKVNR
jgi:hypothetical protein